ncbi:phospholipid carrier-dependent glycosyltransferase [Candidatus Villigracilis affinis]|uniref:phospholipid carrier-dependent glycosyltransferase n=1 Tax=Candidatus Villigracilis affinis TaxID=3140682 RepID=UPI002A22BA8F|nr:phospholipid carrier-dependent glycosyltransferase [Anaerolineales bacterium]
MTEQEHETGGDIRNIRRFIAFLGILFILISQFLIFSQPVDNVIVFPPYTWLAVFGVLILALSQLIRPTLFLQKMSAWFIFQERMFWVLAAFLMSVLVTVATANLMLFARINYIPVVTIWLFSAWAYVYTFFNVSINLNAFLDWLKKNRNEILAVAAITLLAAAFRFYRLGGIPRILDGDEGLIGLAAQTTTSGLLANPFSLWENFGAMYLQLINTSIGFFGVSSFALRLLPAIGGTLAIPSLYLLTRWIGGKRIALITALIIAFSHSHIHFSRIVSVAYIHGTWLAPLELYLLISGLEKRESWRTALGGVLVAIHFSIYLTAQVIIALVFVFMLLAFLFYRPWFKARLSQAMVFWGGFLIVILPSAFYIYRNTNEFLNRMAQNGTFQSGWLELTMQSTGQSVIEILFGRFVHAFLSLTYYPALDFYGSSSPMMSMISSTMFLAGLLVALWRIRNPAYLLLNGYFWGATFSVGIFAIPPSADSYRMLMALPSALVMAALGLDQVLELLGFGWKTSRNAYILSSSAVLVSLLIFNMWTYYGDFAGKCRFGGNLVGRFASYLGSYARVVDNELPIYLLSDSIYFYGSHASTDYLSERRAITNFPDPIDMLEPISGETIIANPERIPELEAWARLHPGGSLHYRYDCSNTILLAYQVP